MYVDTFIESQVNLREKRRDEKERGNKREKHKRMRGSIIILENNVTKISENSRTNFNPKASEVGFFVF